MCAHQSCTNELNKGDRQHVAIKLTDLIIMNTRSRTIETALMGKLTSAFVL